MRRREAGTLGSLSCGAFPLIKHRFPTQLPTAPRCPSLPFPHGRAPRAASSRRPGRARCPRRTARARRCGSIAAFRGELRSGAARGQLRNGAGGESQETPQRRESQRQEGRSRQPGRERPREASRHSPGGLTFSRRSRSRSSSRWRTWARSSASSACCCRHWIFLFTASSELGAAMGAVRAAGRARRCCTWRRAAPRLSMGR